MTISTMRIRLASRPAALAILVLFLTGGVAFPATAQTHSPPGQHPGTIALGLRGVPAGPENDPRSQRYITDHLTAGATVTHRLEVTNNTSAPQRIEVYAGPATVTDGRFVPATPGSTSAVTEWIRIDKPVVHLNPGASTDVRVTITAPARAPDAEQYAAIWASHTSSATATDQTGSFGSATGSLGSAQSSSGGSGAAAAAVDQISRVGVRVYLSTGTGGPPETDFEIVDLRQVWNAVGLAGFVATVANTGGRAVDVGGTLDLTNGPGGLSAPPISTDSVTIAPGGSAQVMFPLAEGATIPAGDWRAGVTLASGAQKHQEEEVVTIPTNGFASAGSKSPGPSRSGISIPLAAGGALLLLVGLAAYWLVSRRRALH